MYVCMYVYTYIYIYTHVSTIINRKRTRPDMLSTCEREGRRDDLQEGVLHYYKINSMCIVDDSNYIMLHYIVLFVVCSIIAL